MQRQKGLRVALVVADDGKAPNLETVVAAGERIG